jgi:transglutaminase-like putative cysteine protease
LKKILLPLFLLISFFAEAAGGGDDDKNIVIENKKQSFLFKQEKGANPVSIKENYVTELRCINTRTSIVYTEMYNDHENIDDVEVSVRNRPFRSVNIQYDYYSVKGIFYSDARICHFQIPFDENGVPAKVTLSKTHNDPRYFTKVYLTEEYFVQNKTVEFIIPRWMKCELKDYNFEGNNIKKTTAYDSKLDADIYTYTMKDLPAFKTESFDQGIALNFPHILVLCKEATTNSGQQTYFKTVADQYKWSYDLVKDNAEEVEALKAKAVELTNGVTGETNKVKTLLNWVHQNIRYIAYEDGIAAFKPDKATNVMTKKYGDCKGMANLLKTLMKGIGLDARVCWIGTNHIPYDMSTPSLSVHNHMITAWLTNGKTYFLDGTETNMAFNQYAERIAGRQVLIENGDKYILTNIPSVIAEQNPDKEKRVLTIDGEDLKGNVEHLYKGEARSDMVNKMTGIKKDNLEKSLINYLSENNQDYVISNLKRSDIPGIDSVLTISYDVLHKRGVSVFGNDIYIDLEFRKDLDDFTIDTAKRRHNMQMPNKILMDQETELTLPPGYKIGTLPANLNLQNSVLDISITYKQTANKLVYHKTLKIKQTVLKKEEFSLWNKQIKELSEKYKEQVVLTK